MNLLLPRFFQDREEIFTYQKNYSAGQSILEVVLAMAIFALLAGALAAVAVGSLQGLRQGGEQTQAEALVQEGMEAVRSIRERAWNENIYTKSRVEIFGSQWRFSGEGTEETIGKFLRKITFQNVCRDGLDAITSCPGVYTDAHSKEATVQVSWSPRAGVTNTVQRVSYLTNWESREWTQTDWSGGPGQTIWSDSTRYDADDGNIDRSTAGEIKLRSASGSDGTLDPGFEFTTDTSKIWPFTVPAEYSYDTTKIEVTAGVARLKISGGTLVTGDTLNPGFNTDANNWTYNDWDQGTGDPNATGTYRASGGNPGGYGEVNLPFNLRGKRLGGFWEQSFTTTAANPTATCEVDWRAFTVTLPSGGANALFVAVYLDPTSGPPTIGNEVLRKDFTAPFAWESHSGANAFDCSSRVTSPGTYFYKLAVWINAKSRDIGPITVGFDNAKVHWQKLTGGSLPTDRPHITPVSSYFAPGVQSWNSFTEAAVKNGASQIYYQLSDDNGATWRYWNGTTWAPDPDGPEGALENDYTTAAVVNANIVSFPTSAAQILFRTFLVSDGVDQVQLDQVTIGLTPSPSPWIFFPWSVDSGEVAPTGTRRSSGGDPNGYAESAIPFNARNDLVGGYWQQAVVVPENGATVTCEFDWRITQWVANFGVDDYRFYVFLDSAAGAPTIGTQIWASGTQSGTTPWSVVQSIDCSAAASIAGTYYYKLAVWLDAKNKNTGPIVAGYDNARVAFGVTGYAISGFVISSAFTMSDASPVQIIEWDETLPLCSPSCQVRFQIQTALDAGGAPGAWSATWSGPDGENDGDETDYYTGATGQLIHTDHNGEQWVRYRALLTGNGSNTPILKEVRINYK